MQPSDDEIQREVASLRDFRRRSTAQGGAPHIIDPDLPSPTSQNARDGYWTPTSSTTTSDSSSDSHSHEESVTSVDSSTDDPFHLFWVPANMHPEIDPAQFRTFLKEHARAPGEGAEASLTRERSLGSASLGRKKSMLSRQYKPQEGDGVEEEMILPLRRNRSSLYQQLSGPQLTISDLERLDELAEEATQSSDPSKLRSVLRRSLSMNMAPSVIDKMDEVPDMGDEADSPIIVPRPGQILRRAARTKIRKPGQTGEGSHRFNATRRGLGRSGSTSNIETPPSDSSDPRASTSSELSSSDHGETTTERPRRQRVTSNESFLDEAPRLVRPESYSVESFIFDSYASDDHGIDDLALSLTTEPTPILNHAAPAPEPAILRTASPTQLPTVPEVDSGAATPSVSPAVSPPTAPSPVLHHPQPTRAQIPAAEEPVESRTPSPEVKSSYAENGTPPRSSVSEPPTLTPATPPSIGYVDSRKDKDKDKDKKGLFGKWGGEKKSKKEKEREAKEKEKEKEKEPGFFGSFFGGSKKKQDETSPGLGTGSHREAAAALLGASKSSKSYVPSPSPQPIGALGNYARYPIHVERAIYRLSHIKLANPRRPLYEQVLISNLMFWYLGVINKAQQAAQAAATPAAGVGAGAQAEPTAAAPENEMDQAEREKKERQEQERAETEQHQQQMEREAAEKERLEQQQKSRKGTLNKAGPPAGGNRRAEVPVRGPQYDMQHRAMENEYGGGYNSRPSSAPPGSSPAQPRGSSDAPPAFHPGQPSVAQPQPQHAHSASSPNNFYVGGGPAGAGSTPPPAPRSASPSKSHLPPGAMPPPDRDQPWHSLASPPLNLDLSSPSGRTGSPPEVNSARHSRSPPPHNSNRYGVANEKHVSGAGGGGKVPARSISAQAVPPQHGHHHHHSAGGGALLNGKGRKAVSAHAAPPVNMRRTRTSEGGEEEDVPLALWQQQQQQRKR